MIIIINDDKTYLVVMGTKKNIEARKNVKIETGNVTMKPDTTEKLSDLQIQETLKFQEHSRANRLIPRMNDCQRMQALKQKYCKAEYLQRHVCSVDVQVPCPHSNT